jgi:hypothetical protein
MTSVVPEALAAGSPKGNQNRHASDGLDNRSRNGDSPNSNEINLDHFHETGFATTLPGVNRPPTSESHKTEDNQDQELEAIEESDQARLERLGRQRPEVFGSIWSEVGFIFSIAMSQVLSVSQPSIDRGQLLISK